MDTMTLDGFLTFLTLAIAAYSIAPKVIQLRIRLKFFSLALITLIGFIAVIKLEIYPDLKIPCPSNLSKYCDLVIYPKSWPQSAPQFAFYIVIGWLLVAVAILARKNLSIWALPTLRRLADELSYRQSFAELTEVLAPHLAMLDKIARQEFGIARLHTWLRRSYFQQFSWTSLDDLTEDYPNPIPPPKRLERVRATVLRSLAWIAKFVPDGEKQATVAQEILATIMLNPAVVEFISIYRPEIGVRLLDLKLTHVHEFCDLYMEALVSNPRSTLYYEIRNNQNVSSGHKYDFPKKNRLLYFLFGNAKNAERLGVWKPLGEWLLKKLRATSNPDYTQSLNREPDGFDSSPSGRGEEWSDPTFIVIRFFDLMVSAAEYQNVEWHMWLYYFPHFLDRLIEIYNDRGQGVDPQSEMPTRAAVLITELFDAMVSWIRAVTSLPEESPHRHLTGTRLDNENGNIPKSAILVLGRCLAELIRAENIGDRLKQDMYDRAVRLIGDLPRTGELAGFRTVLIGSIIQGGSRFGTVLGLREWLQAHYQLIDHVARERLDDYRAALFSMG
jgi:hypothetical protein